MEEPLVKLKKTRRRGPGKKAKLEITLPKELQDRLTQGVVLSGALKRAPDLFLLGGGFYLGYVMNMRPGIDVPLIPGGFVGFPDFGGEITRLQNLVDGKENDLAALTKAQEEKLENCNQSCFEQARALEATGRTFDTAKCVADCLGEPLDIEGQTKTLAELKQDLLKHKIAQGVLMSTLIYAFTRPGFLQGVGEIIPG